MGGYGSGPVKKGKGAKRVVQAVRWTLPEGYPVEIESTFKWLVKQLEGHMVAKVDVFALADMAFYQWQKVEAMKQLAADGITVADGAHGGEPRKHPALTVYRQADMQFQRLALQFGMTPASRARLMPPEPEDDDEFEQFLAGNNSGASG